MVTMVNKENVRKWVEALRSGEYRQGTSALKYEDDRGQARYCCLGVACDISGVGEWAEDEHGSLYKVNDGAPSWDIDASSILLPRGVQAWLGIEGDSPYVNVPYRDPITREFDEALGTHQDSLTGLNDAERYTFAEIADVIEREWLSEEVTA